MLHQRGQRRDAKVERSKFSGESEVYGESLIIDSWINDSAFVAGNSFIYRSGLNGYSKVIGEPVIRYSYLFSLGMVLGDALIEQSVIYGGAVVNKASVFMSWVGGQSRVDGNAVIKNCDITDSVIICGTAVVKGTPDCPLKLGGRIYLDRGYWTRPPIIFECKLSDYTVQESVDGLIQINCTTNTKEKWLGGSGRRYGRLVGLSDEQVDEIQDYTKELVRLTN